MVVASLLSWCSSMLCQPFPRKHMQMSKWYGYLPCGTLMVMISLAQVLPQHFGFFLTPCNDWILLDPEVQDNNSQMINSKICIHKTFRWIMEMQAYILLSVPTYSRNSTKHWKALLRISITCFCSFPISQQSQIIEHNWHIICRWHNARYQLVNLFWCSNPTITGITASCSVIWRFGSHWAWWPSVKSGRWIWSPKWRLGLHGF